MSRSPITALTIGMLCALSIVSTTRADVRDTTWDVDLSLTASVKKIGKIRTDIPSFLFFTTSSFDLLAQDGSSGLSGGFMQDERGGIDLTPDPRLLDPYLRSWVQRMLDERGNGSIVSIGDVTFESKSKTNKGKLTLRAKIRFVLSAQVDGVMLDGLKGSISFTAKAAVSYLPATAWGAATEAKVRVKGFGKSDSLLDAVLVVFGDHEFQAINGSGQEFRGNYSVDVRNGRLSLSPVLSDFESLLKFLLEGLAYDLGIDATQIQVAITRFKISGKIKNDILTFKINAKFTVDYLEGGVIPRSSTGNYTVRGEGTRT